MFSSFPSFQPKHVAYIFGNTCVVGTVLAHRDALVKVIDKTKRCFLNLSPADRDRLEFLNLYVCDSRRCIA
jgi:hypothetical protein